MFNFFRKKKEQKKNGKKELEEVGEIETELKKEIKERNIEEEKCQCNEECTPQKELLKDKLKFINSDFTAEIISEKTDEREDL